ncbi:MAG: class I poly(R)-hydroxyalkanoic acid synthase [Micavibrio sp.]
MAPAKASEKEAGGQSYDSSKQAIDPVALTRAMMAAAEKAAPLLQDYMERSGREMGAQSLEPVMALQERFTSFMAVLLANPRKLAEIQYEYWNAWTNIWQNTLSRLQGESADDLYKPAPGDRRFKSPEWSENLLFDFIKQSYLMTADWMHNTVRSVEGLDPAMVEQIDFYTRQLTDAMAPTNFVLTNPDVLKETIRSGGENLVKGLENLIEDMERGQGALKISTTDYEGFAPGKNLAVTKGSVIFENSLFQLIQYAPATDKVFKTPLMIVPPWINKYYILDMRPENSLVKWLVEEGHTVFMLSWANPDSSMAAIGFEEYMQDGILAALDAIRAATGEESANLIAYCIGGTLTAMTLAWMKAKGMEGRVSSATFLTTLLDFAQAGDLKIFTDEKQIEAMEAAMEATGILPGDALQKTFAVLRANDMIWSFVINNYLLGREPFPFDLLYWNEDSTNLPRKMHSFYLRKMYLENRLIEPDAIELAGVKIDLRTIETPAYFLSTREDHIAPWKATFSGYTVFSGPKKFTLSASGHVAGVVNPPASGKYCFWTSDEDTPSADKWLEQAKETKGSWWPDWQAWVSGAFKGANAMIPARKTAAEIEPAPGRYVKKRLS